MIHLSIRFDKTDSLNNIFYILKLELVLVPGFLIQISV